MVPCWFIGPCHAGCAYHFLTDLKDRLANRVQLTTDGHKAYLDATEPAFGTEIDYAMLEKIYGAPQDTPETRYSPAICMGARKAAITGNPVHEHISTRYFEAEPHRAYVDAPLRSADQWILQKVENLVVS